MVGSPPGPPRRWCRAEAALVLFVASVAAPPPTSRRHEWEAADALRAADAGLLGCCDLRDCANRVEVVHNNLGGRGPDAGERSLRFSGLGAGSGSFGFAEAEFDSHCRTVSLAVTASGAYTPRGLGSNGLHGQVMQIGVPAGHTVHLDLALYESGEGSEPAVAEELVLTVFDVDHGEVEASLTSVRAIDFKDYFLSNTTQLRRTYDPTYDQYWFTSSTYSDEPDGPTDPKLLSQQQLDKAVAFRYLRVSRLRVVFKVGPGTTGHDFLFALKLCVSCGTAEAAEASDSRPVVPQRRLHDLGLSSLDGVWTHKVNPDKDYIVISGTTIRWEDGTTVTRMSLLKDGNITTTKKGLTLRAERVGSGELKWDNGDVWIKQGLSNSSSAASLAGVPPWRVSRGQEVEAERVCEGREVDWGACPSMEPCNTCVPQDCEFGPWAEWYDAGGCLGLCFRHRDIAKANSECGKPCSGSRRGAKKCRKSSCDPVEKQDCELSFWSDWGHCSRGQVTRTRSMSKLPTGGGKTCEDSLSEVKGCGNLESEDCRLSNWGTWTDCSATCGAGWKNRMRRVVAFATQGGRPCEGSLKQMSPCQVENCSGQPCEFSAWTDWAGCDSQSPRQRFRSRDVEQEALGSGRQCEGRTRELVPCPGGGPENCTLSEWGEWESCDRSCGGGQTYRKRRLRQPSSGGGRCPERALRETAACSTQPCNGEGDSCLMEPWSDWSECSALCEGGLHKRHRGILRHAMGGGTGCLAPLEEVASCQSDDCPKADCRWADWDTWSACTVTCGGGAKRRSREVAVAPIGGGKLCEAEAKSEAAPCNTEQCSHECVDGKWGDWSAWTDCSATCGNGFRWRHRDIVRQASSCGQPAVGQSQTWEVCDGSHGQERDACGDRDCELSSWDEWSDCSCTCFGVRERQRTITQLHSGSGLPCDNTSLKEIHPCNPGIGEQASRDCAEAVSDCRLGDWSKWSECPVTCGGGNQVRKREILSPASKGGKPCEAELSETQACGTELCNDELCVDCLWGAWSDWGACTRCADQRYRSRNIERLPNHCGARCDAKVAKEASNCTSVCDGLRFCAWKEWSSWSGCSADCGSGTHMRQRSLGLFSEEPTEGFLFQVDTNDGGLTCAGTEVDVGECEHLKPCVTGCEPVNCTFRDWSDWQEPTCTGLCERTRVIKDVNNMCGTPCDGPLVDTKKCQVNCTSKVDCVFSEWQDWSDGDDDQSSATVLQQYRVRTVIQLPLNGGRKCLGALGETRSDQPSRVRPRDCVLEDWSDWSDCPRTCGGAWHLRSRGIRSAAVGGGKPCGETLEEGQECATEPCEETDCELGTWGLWSHCSRDRQQFRRREVKQNPSRNGKPCESPGGDALTLSETRACLSLRKDCVVSPWGAWDECDKTCGGGEQQRHRQVKAYPENGGEPCPESLREVQGCNTQPCGDQDCMISDWEEWDECSASCDSGQQQRSRSVTRRFSGDGTPCSEGLSETRGCKDADGKPPPPCGAVDCRWDDWNEWGSCSTPCGGGHKARSRTIAQSPREGGRPCEPNDQEEVEPCNTQSCQEHHVVNGQWGQWQEWERCSTTCGGGITWRIRVVHQEANEYGVPATGLGKEEKVCNSFISCTPDRDCEFSSWGDWSECSLTCVGVRSRSRRIDVQGRGKGAWCQGALKETEPCNPGDHEDAPLDCMLAGPADCKLDDWGPWSECPTTCGDGQARRERDVKQVARFGGKACDGNLVETRPCASEACPDFGEEPQDCLWADWDDWAACDKCSGQRKRFRHVMQEARFGGRPCKPGAAQEEGECPRQCHELLYCVWQDWGSWGDCSHTCGTGGKRSRERMLALKSASELGEMDLYEARGGEPVRGLAGAAPRIGLLSTSSRLEILAAFACGYFGCVALQAFGRRRHTAAASGFMESWLGYRSSGTAEPDRRGYMPVSTGGIEMEA